MGDVVVVVVVVVTLWTRRGVGAWVGAKEGLLEDAAIVGAGVVMDTVGAIVVVITIVGRKELCADDADDGPISSVSSSRFIQTVVVVTKRAMASTNKRTAQPIMP